jgi:hypothetical protein
MTDHLDEFAAVLRYWLSGPPSDERHLTLDAIERELIQLPLEDQVETLRRAGV